MAAHVPVVATRVGGIPEIVKDRESALLVEDPRNSQDLARALREIVDDAELGAKLADEALRLAREKHAPEKRAAALLAIYQRVISARSAAM
jgi:glycosyltransferase involved in cell wall biosynthesis